MIFFYYYDDDDVFDDDDEFVSQSVSHMHLHMKIYLDLSRYGFVVICSSNNKRPL
jgi:hypothetical protein